MTDDELKRLFDAMRQENATTHADTRRHFDVTAERMEQRFDLLAESVQNLNEDFQRTRVALEEKIDRSAQETQAMIKFAHRSSIAA